MADLSQAMQALSIMPPPRPALRVVWMYQHPSNRPLYTHYNAEHVTILENAWQAYHNYEGPNQVHIQIPDSENEGATVVAVVSFCHPMTQLSPSTNIRRFVKRYLEEEP